MKEFRPSGKLVDYGDNDDNEDDYGEIDTRQCVKDWRL